MAKYRVNCIVVVNKNLTHTFTDIIEAVSQADAWVKMKVKWGIGLIKVKKMNYSTKLLDPMESVK